MVVDASGVLITDSSVIGRNVVPDAGPLLYDAIEVERETRKCPLQLGSKFQIIFIKREHDVDSQGQ